MIHTNRFAGMRDLFPVAAEGGRFPDPGSTDEIPVHSPYRRTHRRDILTSRRGCELGSYQTGSPTAKEGQTPWSAGDPPVARPALDHRNALASLTNLARTGLSSM